MLYYRFGLGAQTAMRKAPPITLFKMATTEIFDNTICLPENSRWRPPGYLKQPHVY